MYIVQSGAVQIYLPSAEKDAPPVVLKDLRTGEYFGELALFDDKPRSASVRAMVDTVLLELTREELAEHLGVARRRGDGHPERDGRAPSRDERDAQPARRDGRGQGVRGEPHVGPAPRRQGGGAERELGVHPVAPRPDAVWCIVNVPSIAVARRPLHEGRRRQVTGFDPYPYMLYNLVLAILVALQGPLIVMSQNRQTAKDRATAETDFRVNLKNEVGIEKMLARARRDARRDEQAPRGPRARLPADRVRAEVPAKTPGGPLA